MKAQAPSCGGCDHRHHSRTDRRVGAPRLICKWLKDPPKLLASMKQPTTNGTDGHTEEFGQISIAVTFQIETDHHLAIDGGEFVERSDDRVMHLPRDIDVLRAADVFAIQDDEGNMRVKGFDQVSPTSESHTRKVRGNRMEPGAEAFRGIETR